MGVSLCGIGVLTVAASSNFLPQRDQRKIMRVTSTERRGKWRVNYWSSRRNSQRRSTILGVNDGSSMRATSSRCSGSTPLRQLSTGLSSFPEEEAGSVASSFPEGSPERQGKVRFDSPVEVELIVHEGSGIQGERSFDSFGSQMESILNKTFNVESPPPPLPSPKRGSPFSVKNIVAQFESPQPEAPKPPRVLTYTREYERTRESMRAQSKEQP